MPNPARHRLLMKRHTYWLLVILILLTAAGLRLWQLHTYPPGPHYDEAANVLITRSIAFGGANLFPIVPGYQGREALYYYLTAPLFQWVQDGRFSLQLANAFMGLLTTAATIALGRAMFSGRRGQIVGLTAGALMALSFPLLLLARQGFRAPTLPLMQALALLCLWHGLKRGRYGWLAAGGIFAGGALYTYMASRLFPLWLLIGGLTLIVLDHGNWLRRLKQGIVFFGALALAAAPMAIYALQNPDIFLGRLYEVTQPGDSITLAESIRLHLRMFFVQGEILLRYNLPGRPYFTWPEGILLLAGLGVAAWGLIRPGRAMERTAYLLALLAPLMILPSVISVGGFPPNHMRAIGMVPLVFILLGVGFDWLLTRMAAVAARISLPELVYRATPSILTAIFLLAAIGVGTVYFGWAARADLFYDTDADLAAATDWLAQNALDDQLVYIASQHFEHPTVMIADLPRVRWLGEDTLFRPPPGTEGIVIWPHSAPPPPEAWAEWLQNGAMADVPTGPDGRPAFAAYTVKGWWSLPDGYTLADAANPVLTLHGYQASPIFPGASGDVLLSWRVDPPPADADLMSILQVEDDLGNVLARAETPFVQSNQWLAGEEVMYRAHVRIPPGTPPGTYPLRAAWVARSRNHYLSYIDEAGQQAGVWQTVGEVEVLRPVSFPTAESLGINTDQQVDLAPGTRLLAWQVDTAADNLRPGEDLPLTLYWQGITAEGQAATAVYEALLRDESGQDTTIWQGQPTQGRYPPSQWRDGELVVDRTQWSIPRDQPAGTYTLLLRADAVAVGMGTITVAGVPRLFEPPSVEHKLEIGLGDALQLYGSTIELTANDLRVELVWHALVEVDTDYTVFVHVVDENGQNAAQRDVMPVDNTYPTTLWVSGEYVPDTHVFSDLPPGRYTLRVGLYNPPNGQRLPLKEQPQADYIDLGSLDID